MPVGKNPTCLDRVTPGASPVSVTQNYSSLYGNTDSSKDLWASRIDFQLSKTATGPKGYVGYSNMNSGTGVGILHELVPGETWTLEPVNAGSILHVGDFFVFSDHNGDYFQVSAFQE